MTTARCPSGVEGGNEIEASSVPIAAVLLALGCLLIIHGAYREWKERRFHIEHQYPQHERKPLQTDSEGGYLVPTNAVRLPPIVVEGGNEIEQQLSQGGGNKASSPLFPATNIETEDPVPVQRMADALMNIALFIGNDHVGTTCQVPNCPLCQIMALALEGLS